MRQVQIMFSMRFIHALKHLRGYFMPSAIRFQCPVSPQMSWFILFFFFIIYHCLTLQYFLDCYWLYSSCFHCYANDINFPYRWSINHHIIIEAEIARRIYIQHYMEYWNCTQTQQIWTELLYSSRWICMSTSHDFKTKTTIIISMCIVCVRQWVHLIHIHILLVIYTIIHGAVKCFLMTLCIIIHSQIESKQTGVQ